MDIAAKINHIKKSRTNNQRGWMKFVIDIVRQYQSNGYTIVQVIQILEEEHDLKLNYRSVTNEYQKIKQKGPIYNSLKTPEKEHLTEEQKQNKIEQNKELPLEEDFEPFADLLKDEDIVEKQKRENDELFRKNSKGPKWW